MDTQSLENLVDEKLNQNTKVLNALKKGLDIGRDPSSDSRRASDSSSGSSRGFNQEEVQPKPRAR